MILVRNRWAFPPKKRKNEDYFSSWLDEKYAAVKFMGEVCGKEIIVNFQVVKKIVKVKGAFVLAEKR